MSSIGWLLERMAASPDSPAVLTEESVTSYRQLVAKVDSWKVWLEQQNCRAGQVVALRGDYSPENIALLLAMLDLSLIVLLLAPSAETLSASYLQIGEARHFIWLDDSGVAHAEEYSTEISNPLLQTLAQSGHPGLILFTSGSTGTPKASLHDATRFLRKFADARAPLRTMAMPLLDHVAGLDTLFYCLASGGALVCVRNRNPRSVCAAMEKHGVELLPASAAFLNLLLVSEAHREYDLSSVRLVAYGSDAMPSSTLTKLREIFPSARFLQKYGTTELGSPSTRSKDDGSLWVRIHGDGYETKIVSGILWVRSASAMLGYLNAPSPFDADGWLNTEDAVEVDGDYVRFLGRKSDIINVGGQKVYPAEVEDLLLSIPNVRDVTVCGEPNPITGNIVAARFNLIEPEEAGPFKKRVREYCRSRIESFKIPARIEIVQDDQFSERFKKMRSRSEGCP